MINKYDWMGLLGILFIILKLTNVIKWSWVWITSPVWLGAVVVISFHVIKYIIKNKNKVKITDHSLKKGDVIVNVTRNFNNQEVRKKRYILQRYKHDDKMYDSMEQMEKEFGKYELIDATTYGDCFKRYVLGYEK